MFERPIEMRYAMLAREFSAFLEEVVAFDASGEWEADGATSMSAWLAGRFGMARGAARELVRVGRALRSLPFLKEALARGELSVDQLKALTRFVTPEEDEIWAMHARRLSPAELWTECRRRQRVERERVETLGNLRYLWMGWDDDRTMLHGEFELPAEQGSAFEAAVLKASEDVTLDERVEVRDPEGARLADALVGLVTSSGSGSERRPWSCTPTSLCSRDPTGEPRPSPASSSPRKPHSASRAMRSCSGWWSPTGGPWGSDGGRGSCRRGCEGTWCIGTRAAGSRGVEQPDGPMPITSGTGARAGRRDLDNLVLLCGAHHRLIHEGGWTIRGNPSGRLSFHDPTGEEAFARAGPAVDIAA